MYVTYLFAARTSSRASRHLGTLTPTPLSLGSRAGEQRSCQALAIGIWTLSAAKWGVSRETSFLRADPCGLLGR